jgi:hypothetical protein
MAQKIWREAPWPSRKTKRFESKSVQDVGGDASRVVVSVIHLYVALLFFIVSRNVKTLYIHGR